MRPQVARMRNSAAQTCASDGKVRLRDFMARGLEDVLASAEAEDYSPLEIPAEVLAA